MSPSDAQHLVIASAIIGSILLGAMAMVVDAHRNPECPDCYHCARKKATREADRAEKRHIDYHTWTDHRHFACQARDCPGRPSKKKGQ